jgi:hypothetical protein
MARDQGASVFAEADVLAVTLRQQFEPSGI